MSMARLVRQAGIVGPLLLLVAILLVWEIACRVLSVSEFVLPTPSSIAVALVEFAGPIMTNAWRTFSARCRSCAMRRASSGSTAASSADDRGPAASSGPA